MLSSLRSGMAVNLRLSLAQIGEVRSLNKNDFFYFAQFPLNFGGFVELLIGYCKPHLTKILKS